MLKVQIVDIIGIPPIDGRVARASAVHTEKKVKEEVVRSAKGLYLLEIELRETQTLSFRTIIINSV